MLTKSMNANMGIMITASHNQFYDNGLKLFGPDGLKLSNKIENKIEKLIDQDIRKNLTFNNLLGRVKRLETGTNVYLKIIKKRINKKINLKRIKIVLDCANGAGYKAAPKLFKSLNAKIILIGDKPNGFNINKKCGSTYPELIQKTVIKHKANLGISFDGDADRIIMCDEKGSIIDGDQIIAAIALQWKRKKILKGGVVGTLMSNYGLEKFFKQNNIKFIRAKVGDKYVKELMQKNKFNLGGEQSGHIILGKYATTGDGLLVALEAVKALNGKIKASTFFNVFKKTPQILENIKCKKENVLNEPKVKKAIKSSKEIIKGQGRILVRKSGTEPVIRVMGESENINLLKKSIKTITDKLI
jgi:phosphoglucosamine mutase